MSERGVFDAMKEKGVTKIYVEIEAVGYPSENFMCIKCGEEYPWSHVESFRVKFHGSGPFQSCICKKCCKDEPGVEIIEG